ncbi:chemotaxis protein CheD [Oceanidesulfovibrio marinus]|nr:chemotaxis protein CheD [Oceanidesulfovibrio marinus]
MTQPSRPHAATPSDDDTPKALLDSGLPLKHLKISECMVTEKDCLIATVLGSCVSVTFFCPRPRLAGMFHAMLPESTNELFRKRDDCCTMPNPPLDTCKFVDTAIQCVIAKFAARGVKPSSLEVKLFGGAFSLLSEEKKNVREIVDVGAKNVAMARLALKKLGLVPTAESVQGNRGRKLFFHTATGKVWMKYLGSRTTMRRVPRRR